MYLCVSAGEESAVLFSQKAKLDTGSKMWYKLTRSADGPSEFVGCGRKNLNN